MRILKLDSCAPPASQTPQPSTQPAAVTGAQTQVPPQAQGTASFMPQLPITRFNKPTCHAPPPTKRYDIMWRAALANFVSVKDASYYIDRFAAKQIEFADVIDFSDEDFGNYGVPEKDRRRVKEAAVTMLREIGAVEEKTKAVEDKAKPVVYPMPNAAETLEAINREVEELKSQVDDQLWQKLFDAQQPATTTTAAATTTTTNTTPGVQKPPPFSQTYNMEMPGARNYHYSQAEAMYGYAPSFDYGDEFTMMIHDMMMFDPNFMFDPSLVPGSYAWQLQQQYMVSLYQAMCDQMMSGSRQDSSRGGMGGRSHGYGRPRGPRFYGPPAGRQRGRPAGTAPQTTASQSSNTLLDPSITVSARPQAVTKPVATTVVPFSQLELRDGDDGWYASTFVPVVKPPAAVKPAVLSTVQKVEANARPEVCHVKAAGDVAAVGNADTEAPKAAGDVAAVGNADTEAPKAAGDVATVVVPETEAPNVATDAEAPSVIQDEAEQKLHDFFAPPPPLRHEDGRDVDETAEGAASIDKKTSPLKELQDDDEPTEVLPRRCSPANEVTDSSEPVASPTEDFNPLYSSNNLFGI